jgi:hypothetical protein
MRKAFLVLGIILLFSGVIVASASTMATETQDYPVVATAPSGSWEVSGVFNKNEKLIVDFTPPDMQQLMIPEPSLIVLIEVTGPYGSKTIFQEEFAQGVGMQSGTYIKNLTVITNEDGLIISDPLNEVSGNVPYTGNYSANITTRRLWGPPTLLTLKKEVIHREYPYLFVLLIGIPLAVVGGSLSFLSARSSRRKLRPKIKKS